MLQSRRWSPYFGWFPRGSLGFDGNHRAALRLQEEEEEEDKDDADEIPPTGPANHAFAPIEEKKEEEKKEEKKD